MNTAKSVISRYESGKLDLDTNLINRFCDMFGCTSDYLLGRSENPWPVISEQEAAFLSAYHDAPDNVKDGIDTLLRPFMQEKRSAP